MLNLTQHAASPEQISQGVVDPNEALKKEIVNLLTFSVLPTPEQVGDRARRLLDIVEQEGQTAAMIGGAPYLIVEMCRQAPLRCLVMAHAFTQRESAEEKQADGSTKKVAVFRHVGFVFND